MVCIEVAGGAREYCTQFALRFLFFADVTQAACTVACALRLERESFTGKRFAGSQGGIRSMTTNGGPISDTRNGKIGLVGELHSLRCRHGRGAGVRIQSSPWENQIDLFRIVI